MDKILTVAVMQPYFFPYVGYFQLIAQSDVFVLYDDVQYRKGGWINRNRILLNGRGLWLTLPVQKAPLRFKINQRHYKLLPIVIGRLLRRLETAYRKAPHFEAVFPVVREILQFDDSNVAAFNANLIRRLAAHLDLGTRILSSSALEVDDRLRGPERVIAICRQLGATRYINPIGGACLYGSEQFVRAGIRLSLLRSAAPPYAQFGQAAIPSLSIIDAMMFNDHWQLRQLLDGCQLIHAADLA
jgi:hypothetical protein